MGHPLVVSIRDKSWMSNPGPWSYVGRPTVWGNPFEIGVHGTREEVIAKFRKMVEANLEYQRDIRNNLRGRRLACWCAPLPCHADILAEIANA